MTTNSNHPSAYLNSFIGNCLIEVDEFDMGSSPQSVASSSKTRQLLSESLALDNCRALERDNFTPGHMTASAIVLSPSRDRFCLIRHPKLERWLQPGGHVEPTDRSMQDCATRECVEETGLAMDESFSPVLIAIDVHEIPARGSEPTHLHHDMMYVLLAATETFSEVPSRHHARWVKPADSATYAIDGGTRRGLVRAKEYMKAGPLRESGRM